MKYSRYLLLIIILFALGGCSSYGTIPGEMFSAAAKGTTVIADAATQQDAIRGAAVQNRDKEYARAYQDSGTTITFAMVEINGLPAYLPSNITTREKPDFGAPLSQDRQHHRAWDTADKLIDQVAHYGLIGYGAHELAGIVSAGFDAAKGTGDTIIASDQTTLNLDQQRNQQTVTAGGDALAGSGNDKYHENMAEEPEEIPESETDKIPDNDE